MLKERIENSECPSKERLRTAANKRSRKWCGAVQGALLDMGFSFKAIRAFLLIQFQSDSPQVSRLERLCVLLVSA